MNIKYIKKIILKILKILSPYYELRILLFLDNLRRKSFIKRWKNNKTNQSFKLTNHIIKQELIRNFAKKNDIEILVETGSFMGYMMLSQSKHFKKLFSIELSEYYFNLSKKVCRGLNNVEIIKGDSSKELKNLLNKLDEATIFWLDGHYSGGLTAKGDLECPIYDELKSIFESKIKDFKNVIMIDDARLFNGKNDYPKLEDLEKYIHSFNLIYKVNVNHDIIFVTR